MVSSTLTNDADRSYEGHLLASDGFEVNESTRISYRDKLPCDDEKPDTNFPTYEILYSTQLAIKFLAVQRFSH